MIPVIIPKNKKITKIKRAKLSIAVRFGIFTDSKLLKSKLKFLIVPQLRQIEVVSGISNPHLGQRIVKPPLFKISALHEIRSRAVDYSDFKKITVISRR